VPHKCASSLHWQSLKVYSWLWCPMTSTWPSAILCTILWSWTQGSASNWQTAPGSVESQSR
jgi:hypothetical protein